MKILQLNVWGGRLEKQIFNLIEQEQPDILCLQEAISIEGGGDNGGFFATIEEIAAKFSMQVAYSPTIGFRFMSRTAESGNAILSRLPIGSTNTVFTRKAYVKDFDASEADDFNIRNLLHATLKTPQGTVNVLTHHGHHVHAHKNGDEETMRQCKMIADYLKTLNGPIILTGDFNLAPHSESLEQINALLNNLSIQADLTTTRTPLTYKTEVCDYIFVNDEVKVKSFSALEDIVSDHQALVMDFE